MNLSFNNPLRNKRRIRNFFNDIRESIRGTEQDFTRGKLGRGVLLLAVPMVLEMLMESVFAVADIFFVSRIGADAVATVGLTEAMVTVIYALGLGMATAVTAVVSRRIGEKNPREASRAAGQAIFIVVIGSLSIGVIGLLYHERLLDFMGATGSMIESSGNYTRIILMTNGVIMLLFTINGALRSAGDAAVSMRVLWLANILNIILDPCLIFGWGPFPEMGITGAAVATSLGRGLAVVYQMVVLFRGKSRIRLVPGDLVPNWKIVRKLLKLARGSTGQFLISTTSWIALVRIIAVFGAETLAGYTIAIRMVIFSVLPGWGLSNAAATLVGQNLGAGKPRRAEKAVWISGISNMVFLGIAGLVFLTRGEFFIGLFTRHPGILRQGIQCLHVISYGFVAYALGMVLSQAFNGAGDTTTPLRVNFFCFWIFEIPLAFILAIHLEIGVSGAYISVVAADSLMALISVVLFIKGRWKETRV